MRISTLASFSAGGFEIVCQSPSRENARAEDERTFARLENKRHAFPARVVDPQGSRGVCWTDRVVRHGVIIKVAGLAVGSDVLAKQRVFALDGRNRAQNLDLNVTSMGIAGEK